MLGKKPIHYQRISLVLRAPPRHSTNHFSEKLYNVSKFRILELQGRSLISRQANAIQARLSPPGGSRPTN
jgi:hypothetical protein